MSRAYLTVKQYAAKYGIPVSSVYYLNKKGVIKIDRFTYPAVIEDDGKPPKKNPDKHAWRYDI